MGKLTRLAFKICETFPTASSLQTLMLLNKFRMTRGGLYVDWEEGRKQFQNIIRIAIKFRHRKTYTKREAMELYQTRKTYGLTQNPHLFEQEGSQEREADQGSAGSGGQLREADGQVGQDTQAGIREAPQAKADGVIGLGLKPSTEEGEREARRWINGSGP